MLCMQARTRVPRRDHTHGIAAVEALAHKEGLGVQLGDGVVAAQHLQGAGAARRGTLPVRQEALSWQ